MTKTDVPPLSLSLPLQEAPYPDEKARPFFTNLLPESTVRDAVARKLGISARNEFGMLEALGGECAGAIILLPHGEVLEKKPDEYRELSDENFKEMLRNLHIKPFLAGESGIRLSLAGTQDKLPVYLADDRVFLPQGTSPSSHIIKPAIKGIRESIRNEAFCMALAKRIGLNVPDTYISIPSLGENGRSSGDSSQICIKNSKGNGKNN